MNPSRAMAAQSQIVFFYYPDLKAAAEFYEQVMGFELVEDQQWTRIYRVAGNAYLGIVAGEKGFRQPQAYNAVLLTVLVNDVHDWYEYLQGKRVKFLTGMQEKEDIQVRCFFMEDPGGYAIEVQQFLKPSLIEIFHKSEA